MHGKYYLWISAMRMLSTVLDLLRTSHLIASMKEIERGREGERGETDRQLDRIDTETWTH